MKKFIHIGIATVTLLVGLALLIASFIVPPAGIIDASVLTAYGESLTFVGSVLGIDCHYRYKNDAL